MLEAWTKIINEGGSVHFREQGGRVYVTVDKVDSRVPWPDIEDFLPGGLYSILRTIARQRAPHQYRLADPKATAPATVRFPNLLLAGYELTISGEAITGISLELKPPPPSVIITIERPSDKIASRMMMPISALAANMTRDHLVFELIKAITGMTAEVLGRPLAGAYEVYGIDTVPGIEVDGSTH